jgi:CRISPR-associated protein Cmr6
MPEPNRPKLRNSNQVSSPQRHQGKSRKPYKQQNKEGKKPLLPRLENSAKVPVMFRAQIEAAYGSLQFVGKVADSEGNEKHKNIADEWVEEWLKPWQSSISSLTKEIEKPKTQIALALQRAKPKQSESTYELKMPEWGSHIHSWKYQISWRLVTNSGQESDFIRPVLGAKGVPFYPGSSMKGAFAQECTDAQRLKYCGLLEKGTLKTKPGCLRFHGGYPVDTTWANERTLVDVIHPQQNRQVETEVTTGAKRQISLYQTVICFGFSSADPNTDWDEVREIWEKALMNGLGGRTSAGYGQVAYRIEGKKKIPLTPVEQPLLSVYLSGQGITSKLLNGEPEFRPNMFKAALRGHTLRLFSGITDGKNAKRATASLWGDIDKEVVGNKAVVGQLGIQFFLESGVSQLSNPKHPYKDTDLYRLIAGRLDVNYQTTGKLLSKIEVAQFIIEVAQFIKSLIQFSLLLGGFGKSWRRVDHEKFSAQTSTPTYIRPKNKAPIGCHWEFSEASNNFYLNTSDWEKTIPDFLNILHQKVHDWLVNQKLPRNGYEKTWRESWHPENVQVWGRLAESEKDSLAICWFHGDYTSGQTIKGTFAGKIGKIGRVWHRMYPQCIQVGGEWKATGKYIELLTIFPRFEDVDDPDKKVADKFVEFLRTRQDFTKLWGS